MEEIELHKKITFGIYFDDHVRNVVDTINDVLLKNKIKIYFKDCSSNEGDDLIVYQLIHKDN